MAQIILLITKFRLKLKKVGKTTRPCTLGVSKFNSESNLGQACGSGKESVQVCPRIYKENKKHIILIYRDSNLCTDGTPDTHTLSLSLSLTYTHTHTHTHPSGIYSSPKRLCLFQLGDASRSSAPDSHSF